jgi:3',5'-cyclic AMP phosphodiesterase CpdA
MSGEPGLVIAHLSDLHFGAHVGAELRDLLTDVAAADPVVTVVTGDLTMRARRDQFRLARAFVDRLPGRRLVVIGNHDIPLDNVAARFMHPHRRYGRFVDGGPAPVLDVPGARLLGLASMPRWRWKGGRVTRRQAARLVEVLGAAPAGAVRILALHHPLSQSGPARLLGRRRLLAALAAARVDVVLAGHTHRPGAALVPLEPTGRSVVEVVAGTATSTRTRGVARSWTLLRLAAGRVTVEHRFHRLTGWCAGEVWEFRVDRGFTRRE